jgi:hypothetical protein
MTHLLIIIGKLLFLKNLWQKYCIKIIKLKRRNCRVSIMATKNKKKKEVVRCSRCGGRMMFEKFYDVNNVFFGWHCVICGEILDPVILLHRLSQDADLRIPEKEEEVIHLVKKYLQAKPKRFKDSQKTRESNFLLALEDEYSMN